jgi:hypothetical protein
MTAEDVRLGRGLALHERKPLVQDGEPLLRFRMPAGGMEVREGAVAYEIR